MDAFEAALAKHAKDAETSSVATHTLLKEALDRLGTPRNGTGQPATGLYWAIDSVSERVKPFEKWAERFKGVALIILPAGCVIWFLAGDKITHLLHG